MLPALAALSLVPAAPGHATKRMVIQDGAIDIPLHGYPEASPRPRTPPPARSAGGGALLSKATGATSFAGGRVADRSWIVGRLGMTIAPSTDIYRGRDPRSGLLFRLPHDYPLAVKGEQGGYYAVLMSDGTTGWIPATSVQLLEYDVVAEPRPPALASSAPSLGRLAQAVLSEVQRYMGVPYVWGGNTMRGIDCSGLVRNVFARCGIRLPRTAHEQARVGAPVPFSELQAGDRLYFAVRRREIDHTGIYIGGGYFIHSSLSRGGVAISRLTEPLYGPHLVEARRF